MSDPILQVRNLQKHFPIHNGFFRRQVGAVKAVDGIDFTINEGEVVGLVGESGSGKSTVGRAAIRLIEPTEGEIYYRGKNLREFSRKEMREVRKEVQMVFQDPYASLNPRKTVLEAIGESLLVHKFVKSDHEMRDRVAEILELIGLSPEAIDRYPHEFSGGQQQRICIGRAIAMNPKLLICDEAVSALDLSVQGQILNLLNDLKQQLGLSYLFISHDLSVVRYISDRVVVMYLGKVMEQGPVEEVFSNPKHPYTKLLLSSAPKEHPNQKVPYQKLQGEVPSPSHPPKGCPFHPRCPHATQQCQSPPPKKFGRESDHSYQCIQES
jgi:oligopeptide/dipeptide ABC transporter ATP-binding protein